MFPDDGSDLIYVVRKSYLRTVEFTAHYRNATADNDEEEEAEDARVRPLTRLEVQMVTEAVKEMRRRREACEPEGKKREEDVGDGITRDSITEDVAARVVRLTSQPIRYEVTFIDR